MIEQLRERYHNGGFYSIIHSVWDFIFLNWTGRFLKSLLGARLHQKFQMYPRIGYWPQIRKPRTFNEKLMHRKLYTDNDFFTTVSDKWAVREYVREQVGEEVLTKAYHITDDPATIPFDSLPPEYVIKPTHTSGGVTIVDLEDNPDRRDIRKHYKEYLNIKYGSVKSEYWYTNIKPRILIEERLRGSDADIPRDYKFFVFYGEVEYIQVDLNRFDNHTRRLYDSEWNPQDFELKFPIGPKTPEPTDLDQMIEIAECLGEGFDFIRIDLYQTENGVIFGEMTVAPGSGGEMFRPIEYDFKMGSLW